MPGLDPGIHDHVFALLAGDLGNVVLGQHLAHDLTDEETLARSGLEKLSRRSDVGRSIIRRNLFRPHASGAAPRYPKTAEKLRRVFAAERPVL
jgi:hypothetical protein